MNREDVWVRQFPPTAKCQTFGKVCAPPCATQRWVDRSERGDRARFISLQRRFSPPVLDTRRDHGPRRVTRSHAKADPMYYLRPKLQQVIHWIWLPVWGGVGRQVTPKWWTPLLPVGACLRGGMPEERGGIWGPGGESEQRGCSQTVGCLWECFYFSSGARWPQRVSAPSMVWEKKPADYHVSHPCIYRAECQAAGVKGWMGIFCFTQAAFCNPHIICC